MWKLDWQFRKVTEIVRHIPPKMSEKCAERGFLKLLDCPTSNIDGNISNTLSHLQPWLTTNPILNGPLQKHNVELNASLFIVHDSSFIFFPLLPSLQLKNEAIGFQSGEDSDCEGFSRPKRKHNLSSTHTGSTSQIQTAFMDRYHLWRCTATKGNQVTYGRWLATQTFVAQRGNRIFFFYFIFLFTKNILHRHMWFSKISRYISHLKTLIFCDFFNKAIGRLKRL